MATLTYKAKRAVIQGTFAGKRFTLSIPGKIGRTQAESIRSHVNHLIAERRNGQPVPASTAAWIATTNDEIHGRLAQVGLVTARTKRVVQTIEKLADAYTRSRTLEPNSLSTIDQAKRNLEAFFGVQTDPNSITPEEAGEWRVKVASEYAVSTTSLFVRHAKTIFAFAAKKGLIKANPFDGLKQGSMENPERQEYVSIERWQKVADACPSAEWKLIFALARIGGLRVPSEVRTLRWADVNWEQSRFTVRSPKKKRHKGGGIRLVPIFPELLPYLRDVFEQAQPGAVLVITETVINYSRKASQIVDQAGIKPWKKIFQNLRASRETDLALKFPIHVVCDWIGNSPLIAAKHYLMTHETHFAQALQPALQQTTANGGRPTAETAKTPISSHIAGSGNYFLEYVEGGISSEKQQIVHVALQEALHKMKKQKQGVRVLAKLAGRRGIHQ